MKKRTFIGKMLGQEMPQAPASITMERRLPTLSEERKTEYRARPETQYEERLDRETVINSLTTNSSPRITELARAKTDLSQMEQELVQSQRLFKTATDRLAELTRFLSHSEVNLSTLERLEPENERLNATITELKSEIRREKALFSEAEARSLAIESKYVEAQKANEEYRQEALTLRETIRGLKQHIETKGKDMATMSAQIDDLNDKLAQERDTATILSEKNGRIIAEMSSVTRKNLELEKRVEEIHSSNRRNASASEAAQLELKSLRLEYTALRDSNIEKTGRLETLQNEAAIKERNFEENIKYRDNELFGLQSTLEDYKVQLRIKEDVSKQTDAELADLKSMMADETKRRRRLEVELREQQKQLEQNRDALMQSRQNFDDLNRRLVDAQAELRAVKDINQQQALKLEQYNAVGGVVVDFRKEAEDLARQKRFAAEADARAKLRAEAALKTETAPKDNGPEDMRQHG